MKAGIKYLEKPTPKLLSRLGNALLGLSTGITGAGIAIDNDIVAYISLCAGLIGKFLTNLFTE